MAYITSEHLTAYDSKIKQYIETQINSATAGYRQQIAAQNLLIQELTNRVELLENSSNVSTNVVTPTSTPTLRTMSIKSSPMLLGSDDNGSDSDIIVRSISPQSIIVQEDIQEDYVIYDRVISPNEGAVYKNIVVTSDDKSNRIWFSIWKTFDNRDLTDKEINVLWVNADGNKGESLCVNKQVIGDRLYFAWNIPGLATVKAGTITYAIRIVDNSTQGEEYAWHTLPATIECVQGLLDSEWDDLPTEQQTPGWVDYIEGKYKVSVQLFTEEDYEELPEKIEDVLYVVTTEEDNFKLYLGELPLAGGSGGGGTSTLFGRATFESL